MACWLLGFLGFSVSRLVGVSTSYSFVYYIILCHLELYECIYIYRDIIKVYHLLVYCTIFYDITLYLAKLGHTLLYFNI